jgi:hypothetical protein
MCTCGTGRGRVGAGLYNLLNIHIYTHVRTRVALTVTRCVERHGVCVYLCSLSRESSVCGLCDCVRAGGLWGRHLWVRRRSLWQGARGGDDRAHTPTPAALPRRANNKGAVCFALIGMKVTRRVRAASVGAACQPGEPARPTQNSTRAQPPEPYRGRPVHARAEITGLLDD